MALRPVVAGVDGSQESLRAVEWAALEARRHRAPLRIVSVPALPPPMRGRAQYPDAVATGARADSCRVLAEAVTRSREVAPGQLIDVDLLAGPPALAVTQSGSGALTLVVGGRGSGGFAAMMLGSVSRYAAMHASCPVVVVREETSAVHGEVVVGIRDPDDTAAALAYAFDEAALRGATLVAVHSWNWLRGTPGRHGDGQYAAGQCGNAEHIAPETEPNLTEVLAGWHDKYPGVTVRQDVVHDHPAHILASYCARADLVVIGRHGTGSRPAVGGIQHALLSHARGPVAIIPAGS
jgi:nucleotide-binding universal stress UspA family protein